MRSPHAQKSTIRHDRGGRCMARVENISKYCLLCGKELPRGAFSAQVSGVNLYPVCADCQDRCSSDPNRVVAEHPELFGGSELEDPHIHPTPSTMPPRLPVQSQRPTITTHSGPQQVIVTDIHMPFGSMVGFMVKWAIASIPALIILILIGVIFSGVFGTLILGLGSRPFGR
jgi:hypothetical protein